MLDDVERSLVKARDDEANPNVARVAAHASLLLLEKYHSLTDECEVYRIAIGTSSVFLVNVKSAYV